MPINEVLTNTLNSTLTTIIVFLPRFLSGLIVLLLGLIIASFLKQVVVEVFKFLKIETWLKRYGVPESKGAEASWGNIIGELVRWFVIILFFVPVADVWGLGRFVKVLNDLLLYLPNVFIAVFLLLVGFVIARLVYNLLLSSVHGLSEESSKTVANVARWAVMTFVVLVVLSQLGIASDIIKILFQGIVAMVALAGGLAFGLGGKDTAAEILEKLKKKL